MPSSEVFETKGKINDPGDAKKTITVDVSESEWRQFKRRADENGLNMTKVLRGAILDYISEDGGVVASHAVSVRRTELDAYILERLRTFAANKRHDRDFLDWIGKGIGLRPGTLASLLEE